MTRRTIGLEGTPTEDGRLIQHGALTWADEPLPIRIVPPDSSGHEGAHLIGKLTDIRREPDGAITADVGTTEYPPGWGPGFDLDSVDYDIVDDVMVIKSARLRAVTITENPCWPNRVTDPVAP